LSTGAGATRPTQQDAPVRLPLPVDHRSPEQLAGAVLDHTSRIAGEAGQRALESASLCVAELRSLETLPEASQGILELSPLDAYRSDAPPLEVLELVLAHAHVLLVWLAIREAARRRQVLSPWLGETLGGAILGGLKARWILFASAGFPETETLVARAERLDLGALFDQETTPPTTL
jgi:hypothetical protein